MEIFNVLVILIGSIIASNLVPEVFYNTLNKAKAYFKVKRLKPFDCPPCLSFWLTVTLSLFETPLYIAILLGVIAFKINITKFNGKL